jgi:FkbM family methyltransferase
VTESEFSHLSDVLHRRWRRVYRAGSRTRHSALQRLGRGGPSTPSSEYDAQVVEIMRRVLKRDSNGIDVGAAWGEILRPMVKLARSGHHRAFEPLPHLAAQLRDDFPRVEVHELALSDHTGQAEFCHTIDASGYSGLHRRHYPSENMRVETITVQVRRLDDLVDPHEPIAFMKIDVEGAEFAVLRGARECLMRHRPVVVFEYSGEEVPEYGVVNGEFYDYLSALGMAVSTLDRWLGGDVPLGRSEFPQRRAGHGGWHWMYIAHDVDRRPGPTPWKNS